MTITATSPLLRDVLDAHGGHEAWRRRQGLASTVVAGGELWRLKGHDQPPEPRRVSTRFHRQWASFTPFGDPGWTMVWTPDYVMVGQASDLIADRDDPRDAFAGHAFDTPWDPLHLAYFNGYAMWNYHALPFLLAEPGFEVREVDAIVDDGVLLYGLGVRFPEAVHSHSREQRFWFGADGLLRRHDYTVDVWADTPAAHYLSHYVQVDGLQLATQRRVYRRGADGSVSRDVGIVTIDLSEFELV